VTSRHLFADSQWRTTIPHANGITVFNCELPWLVQTAENAKTLADGHGIYEQLAFINECFFYEGGHKFRAAINDEKTAP
jgi:hypothetical protein